MSNKERIFRVLEVLKEESDENHRLSAKDIQKELGRFYIDANVKTIDDDIKVLKEIGINKEIGTNKKIGINIETQIGKGGGSYIASREFKLAELKLLVDVVRVSKFITPGETNGLIEKLKKFTSKHKAKELERNVKIENTVKATNVDIYRNVDTIHRAISDEKVVAFKYNQWTPNGKLEPKKNGKDYIISPWELVWNDENYYLIGYDKDANKIKHYRVDKITQIRKLDKKREGVEEYKNQGPKEYLKKTFGMYGGKDCVVCLKCKGEDIGIIFDRFGTGVRRTKQVEGESDYYLVPVKVSVSNQFFGWLTGVGEKIKIVDMPNSETSLPENSACSNEDKTPRERYKEYLKEILGEYDD